MNYFLRRSRAGVPFVLLSLYVAFISGRRPSYDSYYRARFGEMIYGTAWRPFVGRSLVPFLVRTAASIVPQSMRVQLSSAFDHISTIGGHALLNATDPLLIERALYWSLDILALVLFAHGVWRLMQLSGLPREWSYLSALVVLGSIPAFFNYRYNNYIYDASALALFTWSLVFLAKEKWYSYLVLFTLCIWNKETGILLSLIFFLLHWKELRFGSKKYWGLFLAQAILGAAILISIYLAFQSNAGGSVEWHLFDRKGILFGYSIQTYLSVLLLLALLFYRFKSQPLFLRKALTILPILLTLTFFFGMIDEYRDYYEALPIVATMISLSLWRVASQVGLITELGK